jgi:hypothetical protein
MRKACFKTGSKIVWLNLLHTLAWWLPACRNELAFHSDIVARHGI